MRYVIMANGQGARWGNYNGIPKHLISVNGETLLERTTRLVHEADSDAEVIISSANPQCEADGATRYEPMRNELEIDRFVPELFCEDAVFLYGDTYYTQDAVARIVGASFEKLGFFGNERSIVAVKLHDPAVMQRYFDKVRNAYLEGDVDACKGWQVYYSYALGEHGWNKPADGCYHINDMPDFIEISDRTGDFNTPEDWEDFIA